VSKPANFAETRENSGFIGDLLQIVTLPLSGKGSHRRRFAANLPAW
jgi:hypothetical protein